MLCFRADELQGGWEEGEGWMASLIPIRANLLAGDFRALYLGWLLGVEHGTYQNLRRLRASDLSPDRSRAWWIS